jgi:uncharacterized protein (UPF0332 family)
LSIEHWLARAERSLTSAQLLAADGDHNGASSAAYYAMFYAAKAALIHADQAERAAGKTHSGLVAAVYQFLVKPGLLENRHGEAFAGEFHRRLIADYAIGVLEQSAATEAIARAAAFLGAVAAMVQAQK